MPPTSVPPATVPSLSRTDRVHALVSNYKRRELVEMAKAYVPVVPRTWVKPKLAEIIVDGQDGIESIPGAPAPRRRRFTAAPYTELTSQGALYIHNRAEGYTRRIRQQPDARGGLSSSLQFETAYGTTTVVTRVRREMVDAFNRDVTHGTAGLTGQLMDKERNGAVGAFATAFAQLQSVPMLAQPGMNFLNGFLPPAFQSSFQANPLPVLSPLPPLQPLQHPQAWPFPSMRCLPFSLQDGPQTLHSVAQPLRPIQPVATPP